jgi:predicted membrane GTPase involved in stress response
VEVTPKSIRMRKIILNEIERKRKKIWAIQDAEKF